ncbi:MAG: single-stranded DNA-binding protein [Nocardioides sp.]|nr:single-stranded DNA-binding protein [Nocardioides sp.]
MNEVRVRGRVASAPQARTLPSGDELWTFRLVVPRSPQQPRTDGRRAARSDWMTCTVWTARCRRAVSRWSEGDEVEVEGALRRRHYRTPTGATSVLEVEVAAARRARG